MKQDKTPTIVTAGKVAGLTTVFLLALTSWESGKDIKLKPYLDPAGILTVCDGITNRAMPGFVIEGKTYTKEECTLARDSLLKTIYMPGVAKLVKHDLTQDQFLMLTDFAWNKGLGNLKKSSLLIKVNSGDCNGAGLEFLKWVRSGGQVMKGLTNRARWNSTEFLKGCSETIWSKK